jgi:aminoglycoside/choline kinase family phosphotransferase
MVRRYCDRAAADGAFDETAFRAAYAVLGAQRASKILGIFVRLARRDGKTGYLRHIPRVSRYLERNLAHPALAGLRAWYDRHLPAPVRERT